VESKIEETPDLATLRLKWDHSSSDVYYYTVYRQNPDASYSYLWGTSNNACFVPAVTRVAQETSTTIAVQAVAQDFGTSDFSTTVINWDVTQTPDPATNPYPQDQAEFASINITDLLDKMLHLTISILAQPIRLPLSIIRFLPALIWICLSQTLPTTGKWMK
jgi:hypothetical protein